MTRPTTERPRGRLRRSRAAPPLVDEPAGLSELPETPRRTSFFPLLRILAPVDFSAASLGALRAAEELASHFGAELLLLHVLDPATTLPAGAATDVSGGALPTFVDFIDGAEQQLKAIAHEALSPTTAHRCLVKPGPPPERIVATADTEQVDLIVIPTHGRSGVKRLFFGSVTEKVVRTARCPVLTFRRDEAASGGG